MNLNQEDRELLGNIATELGHIKNKLDKTNEKLDAIVAGQKDTNSKLDTIITNTTPMKGEDVASFAVTVDPPVKINP